jgi:hypothetical protein
MIRSPSPPTNIHLATPPGCILTSNPKHPIPHLLGQAFSSRPDLDENHPSVRFLSSFLYFVCDAEHLRLSLIDTSLPSLLVEFTWPSAPLIIPPTSPLRRHPFVTPPQLHARAHNYRTTNSQLPCFTPPLACRFVDMSHIITPALLLALVAPGILAQNAVQCGNGQLCPSDLPCCSRKALSSDYW